VGGGLVFIGIDSWFQKSVQNPYKSDHFREREFFTLVTSTTYNFTALKCTDFPHHSSFAILSSLDIRHSSFVIPRHPGPTAGKTPWARHTANPIMEALHTHVAVQFMITIRTGLRGANLWLTRSVFYEESSHEGA
jgi:hypothetical protein